MVMKDKTAYEKYLDKEMQLAKQAIAEAHLMELPPGHVYTGERLNYTNKRTPARDAALAALFAHISERHGE